MRIRVVGSAAGGGYPQWNCNCVMCRAVRENQEGFTPRTQSSIAVEGTNGRWLLVNVSPDIRAQIEASPPLQPRHGVRDSGIGAILLMDSQIDHVTGLIMLRESGHPLPVYCTERVRSDLESGFPIFRILDSYCGVDTRTVTPDRRSFTVPEVPGIRITPVPLTSAAPPYSPHRAAPDVGDNIGILIEGETGGAAFYAPGLGEADEGLDPWFRRADCLLVDGTTWTDDELSRQLGSGKRAREMGHLPQSGPGGTIELLRRYDASRKVLIHINNTNPILNEHSPERGALRAEGIEVAYDGMEIELGGSLEHE